MSRTVEDVTTTDNHTPVGSARVISVQIKADDIRDALKEEEPTEVTEDDLIAKATEVLDVVEGWDVLRAYALALKPAFEARAWQDVDSWSIESLTCMIDCGVSFIQWEEASETEPQVDKMRAILVELVQMLGVEINEDPSEEAALQADIAPGVDEIEYLSVPAVLINKIQTVEEFELRYGKVGEREVRYAPLVDPETRAEEGESGQLIVSGYAAVYNKRSMDLGFFTEYIMPGAFDDVLSRSPDVHLLWDHDTRYVLARTKNESLDLRSQELGLRYSARMAPTTYASDLAVLLERRDVDQASFSFTVADDTWEETDDGSIVRRINKIGDLYDVTITARGAYPQTTSEIIRGYLRTFAEARGVIEPATEKRSNLKLTKARTRARAYRLHQS